VNRTILFFCLSTTLGFCFSGCESSGVKSDGIQAAAPTASASGNDSGPKASNGEPAYITVQHCLIGFQGSVPGKPITRSKEEARELATQLLGKLKAGDDFDEVIRKHTDDSPPGIYKMANHGMSASMGKQIYGRADMVAAFGDTGFPLQVGEFGLAEHDTVKSPFGWHIIKRIE
jgi:hypothetical protein